MPLKADNPLSATLLGLLNRLRREKTIEPVAPTTRCDGLRCLITGASSGLGKALAFDLARRGAALTLPCRSGIPEVGDAIRERTANRAVRQLPVDLADLDAVDALCDDLAAQAARFDVVICNAAVMPRRSRRTTQGFELMFGVNYLAHARLVQRVLDDGVIPNRRFADNAARGRRPRIVIVTSEVHRTAAPLNLEHLGRYVAYGALDGLAQYGHSKLLLATFAQQLSRLLQTDGRVDVAVHALCPGAVNTNLAREAPAWLAPVLRPVMRLAFAPPERAAEPLVYLAAATAIEGETGLYLHGLTPKPAADTACDPTVGDGLWRRTAELLERRAPDA